jgi:sulfonate transport system ATP-binding protein
MNAVGQILAFPRDYQPPSERLVPVGRDQMSDTGVSIRISHIAKRFDEKDVLTDVSLDIAPGEFVAIVGHSGCGKSTLLRLVAGLDTPNGGEIHIGDRPVAGQVDVARIMFQDSRLLPWRKVLANVGIGQTGGWRATAMRALAQVGLENRADEWPLVLSGGQRQRVALARALVSQPKLMLLDEPLGALDALTRLEMQRLVEDVWRQQGFTALLVTHDVGEAVALADRVVVLKNGRVELIESVDRPRPRRRGDAALAEIEGRILERLMQR